jgi:hypothetical protein
VTKARNIPFDNPMVFEPEGYPNAFRDNRRKRNKIKTLWNGLVPGVKLTVLNQDGAGPVMVAVKDAGLAIGHGMAEKIIIE